MADITQADLEATDQAASDATSSILKLGGSAANTAVEFAKMQIASASANSSLLKLSSNGVKEFDNSLLSSTEHLSGFLKGFDAVTAVMRDNVKAVLNTDVFKSYNDAIQQVRDTNKYFIDAATQSGNFNKEFAKFGDENGNVANKFFGRMQDSSAQFIFAMGNIGKATGISYDQVSSYATQLGKLQGGFTNINVPVTIAGEKMTNLEAQLRLASGAGFSMSEALDITKRSLDEVSNSKFSLQTDESAAERTTTYLATIGALSKETGAPLSKLKDVMQNVSSEFGMMGDSSQGAARLIASSFQTLRESGMTASQALDTIKGYTAGINNLKTAQMAFLSAQTGGAGGLRGGFQIEKLIKDGKIDEVFQKTQEALRKQFGKIVSFEQATQSDQAAAQYQKQLQLLQNGPLGSFAKDRASAERILDSFTSNKKFDTSKLGEQGIKRELDIGTQKLESQRLTSIDVETAAITAAQINLLIQGNKQIGNFSDYYNPNSDKDNQANIQSARQRSLQSKNGATADTLFNQSLSAGNNEAFQVVKSIENVVASNFSQIKSDAEKAISKLREENDKKILDARSKYSKPNDFEYQKKYIQQEYEDKKKEIERQFKIMESIQKNSAVEPILKSATIASVSSSSNKSKENYIEDKDKDLTKELTVNSKIDVSVTCPSCHAAMDSTAHVHALSPRK